MAAVDFAHQYAQPMPADQGLPVAAYGVTQEYVRSMTKPADVFFCPLTANNKELNFVKFTVRTLDEGRAGVLFENARPEDMPAPPIESLDDSSRFIRYHFGPEFLDIKTIGACLEFTIGGEPLHDFVMIERHYFRDQLLSSYEFSLPFVIPGTRNTWEMIYTKPELNDEWKAALMNSPWESRSDSFFFVEGQLVMHNRAEYNYLPKY